MEELLHVERQFAEEAGLAMIRAALSHHDAQPRNFEGVRVHMGDYLPENSRILAFRSEWGREFSRSGTTERGRFRSAPHRGGAATDTVRSCTSCKGRHGVLRCRVLVRKLARGI